MSETEVTTEGFVDDTDSLDTFADDFFGRKETAPVETKTEVEQAGDDGEQVETEAQTELSDADKADEEELKEEIPQKRKTVQDRIDELVKQREDVKRETAAEVAALRQEIENLKKGATPAAVEAKEPTPDDLKADGEPKYALGEFDPQYIRDLTRYTLETERAKVMQEAAEAQRVNAAQQEAQQLQTQWNAKVAAAEDEYPDFVERGQALLNGFNDLPTEYAGYLSSVLMSMDKGTDVLYYLSNHPDEAREIVNSGAQKATIALGRIEARFMQGDDNATKTKVTKAPTPPGRAQARGTNGAFISVAPDTDDLDAFESQFFKK